MLQWILETMRSTGYLGIALLMLLENLFPPIPSELIMPLAGVAAARGELSLAGVIAAGSAGSLAGVLPWYWLGYAFGRERLLRLADRAGKYVFISRRDVEWAADVFGRYGFLSVLIGRLIPGLRTVISLPAGLFAMPFTAFILCTAVGTAVWSALLATIGYLASDQIQALAGILGPIGTAVLIVLVLALPARHLILNRLRGRDQ